jgi:hypothetical protein
MISPYRVVQTILGCAALGLLLSGCSPRITARNAAPNVTPGADRQRMIEWHQQHDRPPAVPAPGR